MRNVLVTGGASGLGKAIVEKLAGLHDVTVFFTYFQSERTAKELENKYSNVQGIHCQFTDSLSVDRLLSRMESLELFALVNNAHVTPIAGKHFHKTDVKYFVDGFMSNVIPTVQITQKAINLFRKKREGKIITILSSSIIDIPPTGYAEYTALKAYLHSLCKSWATENATFGITSNCISPSFMETSLTGNTDSRIIEELKEKNPLKRLLEPSEVASAVEFFVNSSSQINGTNLLINAAIHVI
jgi:3-oxoacyl-[acyl-carrier protein] reductase